MNNEIDWSKLPFGYLRTDYNVRCEYRDGKWGEIQVSSDENINLHMAATALHYGQEIFEGLKAFRGKDNKIRIFRLKDNARRMRESAEGLLMDPCPKIFSAKCVKKLSSLMSVSCRPTAAVHHYIYVRLKSDSPRASE